MTDNPKDRIGSDKLPLHLWPDTATALGCLGMFDGALKYGRSNWRAAGIRATVYVDACRRHLAAWLEGEDDDPDSGLPHMAHALATLAILIDADAARTMTDDRNVAGGYRDAVDALTPHVARLRELHADRSPRHYTIEDDEELIDEIAFPAPRVVATRPATQGETRTREPLTIDDEPAPLIATCVECDERRTSRTLDGLAGWRYSADGWRCPSCSRPPTVTGESARAHAEANYCRGCLLPRGDCNCREVETEEVDGRTA